LQIFYYTSLKFHLKLVTMRKTLFDTLENFTLSITQRPFFHTPQTFNESKNSLAHTFTFKFDTFKNLKNKFFFLTLKTYNKKSFFHTSHSLRNGFLLSLQPCKLKTFPQRILPCYVIQVKPLTICCFNAMSFSFAWCGPITYWNQLEDKQEMKHSRFMKWNNRIN
jgi:hypothetical protein